MSFRGEVGSEQVSDPLFVCSPSMTPARKARGGGAVCRCAETVRRWQCTRRDIAGEERESLTRMWAEPGERGLG